MTLKADNTDTNISMMHSSTTFLLYWQKGCLIMEEWQENKVVSLSGS